MDDSENKKFIWNKKMSLDKNSILFLILTGVYFVLMIAWGGMLWNQQTNLELGSIVVLFFIVIINTVYAFLAGILSWRSFKNIEIAIFVTWLTSIGFDFLLNGRKSFFSLFKIDGFFSIQMLPIYITYAIILLTVIVRKVFYKEQRYNFFRIFVSPIILLVIIFSVHQVGIYELEANEYDQQSEADKFKKDMLVLERTNQEAKPPLIKEIENWKIYKKSDKKIIGDICPGSDQRFMNFVNSINNEDVYELTIGNNTILYTHNTGKFSNGILKQENNGFCNNFTAVPLHVFEDKIIWDWNCEQKLNTTELTECAHTANTISSYYQNIY